MKIKESLAAIALAPLVALGGIFSFARYIGATVTSPAKAIKIAYMTDQTANVSANGEIDETISARAAKARNAGRKWGCILCKLLDTVQKDHCTNALKNDIHNPTKEI